MRGDVAPAHVVGHDQNDVRPGAGERVPVGGGGLAGQARDGEEDEAGLKQSIPQSKSNHDGLPVKSGGSSELVPKLAQRSGPVVVNRSDRSSLR